MSKLHVIHYSTNDDLSESVRTGLPDEVALTIFRIALNSHLHDGKSEMHAYVKAYRALEDAGYIWNEEAKTWSAPQIGKSEPGVGDVHVDRPLGSDKKKKPRQKDDAGTQFIDANEDGEIEKKDRVVVDVPLFIRLLELAREEIKEDVPLHQITERITALLEDKAELTMDDYNSIVAAIKKGDEPEEEPITKKISGQSDISLNAAGQTLAQKLGERLAAKGGLDVLHTSSLPRAWLTAEKIAVYHKPAETTRTDDLRPWRMGKLESEAADHSEIRHFIEHPDEVPPGMGNDGKPGESFDDAKIRLLDYLLDRYTEYEIHPDVKIGVVMHSRGMMLLKAWVDAGCPEDYKLTFEQIYEPKEPEHADALLWRDGKVEEVDLESDTPLKPGVYLIRHSLTNDDDPATANEELEKYDPDQPRDEDGRWSDAGGGGGEDWEPPASTTIITPEGFRDDREGYDEEHDTMAERRGFDSVAQLVQRGGIRAFVDEGEIHVNFRIDAPAAPKHAIRWLEQYKGARVKNVRVDLNRRGTRVSQGSSFPSVERAIAHIRSQMPTRKIDDESLIVTRTLYMPPIEVHKACKSALESGVQIPGITEILAAEQGIPENDVRRIAGFFNSVEAGTATQVHRDAWGGFLAQKWASRVIRKIERETPWIGVDLDKTLAQAEEFKGPLVIGEPVPAMLERVKTWLEEGERVKIFTARVAEDPGGKIAQAIQDWTERHLGRRLEVTNEKDKYCKKIVDDIAEGVVPNKGVSKGDPVTDRARLEEWVAGPPSDSLRGYFNEYIQREGKSFPNLYRGMQVKSPETNPILNTEPGKTVDIEATSFSQDPMVARRFATENRPDGDASVFVRVLGPVKGLDINEKMSQHFKPEEYETLSNGHPFVKDKEVVSAGKFEVVRRSTESDGTRVVVLRPTVRKADDEGEGEWITVQGQHILIGDDGEVKGGNPVLAASFPRASTKSEIARRHYSPAKADVQREADRTEKSLAKALGADRTPNNSPFDLKIGRWGLEVKTFTHTKNGKITMNKEARARKIKEARKEKLKVGTIVADKRQGQTKYYFTRGVGSFRLGSLQPMTLAELKEKLTK
jgi:broad specificity phosphatase PhoE